MCIDPTNVISILWQVYIGAVVFSSKVRVEFSLAEGTNLAKVLDNIDKIKYDKRSTNIAGGLEMARKNVFGQDGDREDVPNTAILITDGVPNIRKRDTLKEAETLQKVASVVTLGVTPDVDEEQLQQVASDPKLFVLADDFTKMRDVVKKLATLSCETVKPKGKKIYVGVIVCMACCDMPYDNINLYLLSWSEDKYVYLNTDG